MSGGGGSDTVVQRNDPPEYAQPYIQYGLGEAQNQYQTGGPSFYPGSTLAPQSPETQAGIGALASRGMTGNPLVQGAQQQQQGTVGGQYLNANPANPYFSQAAQGGYVNPALGMLQSTAQGDFIGANPYLDASFNQAAGNIRSNVDSLFSGAGRYGSGAHQDTFQQGLNQLATGMYGGAYNQERANQLNAQQAIGGLSQQDVANRLAGAGALAGTYGQERGIQEAAAGNAPSLAATDYQDIAAVGQAGQMRDQYGQAQINADRERFDFAQQSPQDQLARYMALISGGTVGGTSTSTQPSQNNLLAQLGGLGLGIGGLGLAGGWW
jgi:hypothetical protein